MDFIYIVMTRRDDLHLSPRAFSPWTRGTDCMSVCRYSDRWMDIKCGCRFGGLGKTLEWVLIHVTCWARFTRQRNFSSDLRSQSKGGETESGLTSECQVLSSMMMLMLMTVLVWQEQVCPVNRNNYLILNWFYRKLTCGVLDHCLVVPWRRWQRQCNVIRRRNI